jgi:hypothetical protein
MTRDVRVIGWSLCVRKATRGSWVRRAPFGRVDL